MKVPGGKWVQVEPCKSHGDAPLQKPLQRSQGAHLALLMQGVGVRWQDELGLGQGHQTLPEIFSQLWAQKQKYPTNLS
jgi:hypothetical protein